MTGLEYSLLRERDSWHNPGGGAAFATTHWSVVEACADDENSDSALTRLCQDYWPPLYSFACRRGNSSADAQDLVQGFFVYLLQSKAYAQTDRRKGKFRSFLLASFKNYMTDAWDKARAAKRGGDYEFVLFDDEVEAARFTPTTSALTAGLYSHPCRRRWLCPGLESSTANYMSRAVMMVLTS